jgi:hypothetical protein
MNEIPFFLHEAVLTLYPASADGALLGAAVWSGALANSLRMSRQYEEVKVMGAGERYATAHAVDEEHVLTVERTWILRRALPQDFVPGRNQQYLLEIVWSEDPAMYRAGLQRAWHRRTYYGVTGRSIEEQSVRTNQFAVHQTFRAQRFAQAGGVVEAGGAPIYTPLPEPTGTRQPVGFFHEARLGTGAYLLGHYRWPVAARLLWAKAVAYAPASQAVVLGLEVNGMLTGATLTLPAASNGQEVRAEAEFDVAVALGESVRWQVISAPASSSAWGCSLVMEVAPVG